MKDATVEEAVTFILHKDNNTTVSWENIECLLSKDGTVFLPQIRRRVPFKIDLLGEYCNRHLDTGDK